jgi:DNA-binding transcriptional MocR family regulator
MSEPAGPEFAKLSLVLLRKKDLSFGAKCLYARLGLYAGEDRVCTPSHRTLACELGVSDRYVRKLLTELRKAGLVTWRRTQKASAFTVHPPASYSHSDRNEPSGENGSPVPNRSEEKFRSDRKRSSDKKMSLKRGSSKDVNDYDSPPQNRKKRDSEAESLLFLYPNIRDALREHLAETDPRKPSRDKVIRIIQATGHAPEPEILAGC